MVKPIKSLKVQYKNWSCYQVPYTKSSSGCIQHIVCNDIKYKKDIKDDVIIRSTKRQLYRYLKWFVDSNEYRKYIKTSTPLPSFPVLEEVYEPLMGIPVDDDDNDDLGGFLCSR